MLIQTAEDADSMELYGRRTLSIADLLHSTTAATLERAEDLLKKHDQAQLYPSRLVMRPKPESTVWPLIFDMTFGDTILVRRRPPGGGEMIELTCFVIGVTYDITPDVWEITWDLAKARTFMDPWLLGQVGRSELGDHDAARIRRHDGLETPRTWVTDELVTAALMNTHVRDNFNAVAASGRPQDRRQSVTSSTTLVRTTTALVLPSAANEIWQFSVVDAVHRRRNRRQTSRSGSRSRRRATMIAANADSERVPPTMTADELDDAAGPPRAGATVVSERRTGVVSRSTASSSTAAPPGTSSSSGHRAPRALRRPWSRRTRRCGRASLPDRTGIPPSTTSSRTTPPSPRSTSGIWSRSPAGDGSTGTPRGSEHSNAGSRSGSIWLITPVLSVCELPGVTVEVLDVPPGIGAWAQFNEPPACGFIQVDVTTWQNAVKSSEHQVPHRSDDA